LPGTNALAYFDHLSLTKKKVVFCNIESWCQSFFYVTDKEAK
jgi:hypothetical protein